MTFFYYKKMYYIAKGIIYFYLTFTRLNYIVRRLIQFLKKAKISNERKIWYRNYRLKSVLFTCPSTINFHKLDSKSLPNFCPYQIRTPLITHSSNLHNSYAPPPVSKFPIKEREKRREKKQRSFQNNGKQNYLGIPSGKKRVVPLARRSLRI